MANQLDFRVKNGLIVGGDANITGAITSVDSIQLDTAVGYVAPVEGQLKWHEDEGSFAIGLDGSVVADLPETTLYRVTNNTGSTIPKGTLVASVGTTGNSGKILVSAWNPATQTPVQIMGITTGQILSGGDGHVTHFGKIRGIQTNGGNYSEVWVNRDILYAGPNGGLTKTVPTAPSTKTIVAIVISSHASNGTLFVRPSLSSSIANDDLVQLTSIAGGDLLVYNSTAGRFENSKTLPGMVISGSSTGDALRITQTGTGNALVVEDSANPDASPFLVDANGFVVAGANASYTTGLSQQGRLAAINNVASTGQGLQVIKYRSTSSLGADIELAKSASTTVGTNTAVANNDLIGTIWFNAADGTNFIPAVTILAEVDGTPSTNDMPGRLVFSTTADGASSPTERVRITSAGKTGFATSAPAATVHVAGDTILSNVNVLGASYDSVSFSVAGQELTPQDLFFRPDGLKMYVIGSTGDDVNEYNLSTAWVVSSAVFVTNFSVSSQDTALYGVFFRADGTKMYIVGATNDAIFQYTLSTPWSIATASYDSVSFSVAAEEITPSTLSFKPNGLSMYVAGALGDAVYQYTLSTAWDVSTATFLQSFSVSGQDTAPNGISFTSDGSRMFVVGTTGDDVNVYNLTTPWDISTAAFVGVFSVSGQDTAPNGIYIKPDGTKMYIVGATNDAVFQYTVPSIDIQLTGQTSAAALNVQQDLNVYGNTTGSFRNNSFKENIGGQYYNLVSQADIGTSPNEIPLNQYLGNLAYQDAESIAGHVGIGGNLTLNAGTANGVAYLDGSKVLTTGSALTFDGGSLSNTRASGSFATGSFITNIGSVNGVFSGDSSLGVVSVGSYSNHPVAFYQNNTEQMRLTSTGLGIGTSSPNYLATLYKASLPVLQLANSASGSTASDGLLMYLNGSNAVISNQETGSLLFETSGTLRATLDSSGNLGLGVTPSAWSPTGTPSKAIELKDTGGSNKTSSLASAGGDMQLSNNAIYDGANWKYVATAAAANYYQSAGTHVWRTAPSGTAGNAISFTQSMTLDSSGNLLVGTTSSSARLTVVGTGLTASFANGTAYQGVAGFGDAALGNGTWNWRSLTTPGSGVAQFWTRFASTTSGGTAVHNVMIDGDLLIGTTLTPGNSGSVGARKGSTGELILLANDGGLYQQSISNYYLITTAGGNTSDASLKKNVQQLSGALAKVCAIRGVNFEFIAEQKSTPDNGVQVGVIAQEVEAQYPEIVVTNEDGIKSVRYEKLVAPLIEAIKELKAEFDAYKASHP